MSPRSSTHARPGLAELETAGARLWPAAETQPLHGWMLRAGGAHSRRLNSVQTLAFASGVELGAAIDAVEAWYRARGLPACFQLTNSTAPDCLDAALDVRGYARFTPTSVMLAEAGAVAGPCAIAGTLTETITPPLLDALCDPGWTAAVRRERTAVYDRIGASHRFVLIHADGEPAAAGLCVVEGDLGAIFSMRTQARFRRRGLARAALFALAEWSRAAGARWLFLQVEDDNPVQELYRAAGFTRQHGYHYRELPI